MEGDTELDRREFIKRGLQFAAGHKVLSVAVPGGALGVGVAEYETRELTLTKLTLPLKRWPQALNGYTIVQLSDLHLETLQIKAERIVTLCNRLNPDLLVITGDIISASSDLSKLGAYLKHLKAKDEKVIVMGNNDYSHFSHTLFRRYVKTLNGLGYTVLINSATKIKHSSGVFWLVGVDDPATAHDDVDLSFASVENDGLPRLVLAHSTDCIDGLYQYGADLLLTGHTHGGQIKLPFIGPPLRNTLLANQGIYEGYHLINGLPVYISRGIGTSVIPLRLGAIPEITLLTLVSGSKG